MNDIVRWRDTSPLWNSMSQLEKEFDHFFKDPFFSMAQRGRRVFPKINVKESDEKYMVEVSLPGFKPEDVNLEFKDKCLHISSMKREEKLEEGECFLHREIGGRSFHRVIPFEKTIDEKKIKAKYENGILIIELFKTEPKKEKITKIKIE